QSTVAQRRIDLAFLGLGGIKFQSLQRVAESIMEAEVDEIIDQGAADEELKGQIIETFSAGSAVALFGCQPCLDETVAGRQGGGAEDLGRSQRVGRRSEGVRDMARNGLPELVAL